MYVEFSRWLNQAAQNLPVSAIVSSWKGEELLNALLGMVPMGEVDDCPKHVPFPVFSNIAFCIAERMRKCGIDPAQIAPGKIAAALVEGINCGGHGVYFRAEASEIGHINGEPTALFVDKFFTRLFDKGEERLFMPTCFVVDDSMESGEFDEPQLLMVRWEKTLKRVSTEGDSDLARLWKSVAEGRSVSPEQGLMLLCLVDDDELEVSPFLAGLSGSQNIPWYCRRFVRDCSEVLKSYGRGNCVEFARALGAVYHGSESDVMSSWIRVILQLRRKYLFAKQSGRAEVFAGWLLRVIRSFYRCYNQPRLRQMLRGGLEDASLAPFFGLAELSLRAVQKGLMLVEFPCDERFFRLNVQGGSIVSEYR